MADDAADTKKTCFVISPIGGDNTPERRASDQVLKHLIKRALEPAYTVKRGDADDNPGAITPQIIGSIVEADLIVADLSGANPNVFYELAIAHGYEKAVIHVQRASDPIAFDIKDMRVIRYDTTDPDSLEAAVGQLAKSAHFATENPTKIQTPLTAAERFVALQASTDPIVESQREIIALLRDLRSEMTASMRRSSSSVPTELDTAPSSGDAESLMRIVEGIAARGALRVADLADTITAGTTFRFDEWMRHLATKTFPDTTVADLQREIVVAGVFVLWEERM